MIKFVVKKEQIIKLGDWLSSLQKAALLLVINLQQTGNIAHSRKKIFNLIAEFNKNTRFYERLILILELSSFYLVL